MLQRQARPADRRVARLRHRPGPRRGRAGQDEAQVRRRGDPAPAQGPLPGDDQEEGHRTSKGNTRNRPAAAASSASASSTWSPCPAAAGFEFVDKIFGGSIPQNYRPAVEKGIRGNRRARLAGRLAGGRFPGHPDRRQVPQRGLVGDGVQDRRLAGLQGAPWRRPSRPSSSRSCPVEITAPEEYMGDIMGDLSSRRGKPQGMEAQGRYQVIKAQVPMSEMLDYASTLKSHDLGPRIATTWSSPTTRRRRGTIQARRSSRKPRRPRKRRRAEHGVTRELRLHRGTRRPRRRSGHAQGLAGPEALVGQDQVPGACATAPATCSASPSSRTSAPSCSSACDRIPLESSHRRSAAPCARTSGRRAVRALAGGAAA